MAMRRGAVALLDALGFKGIWKHSAWTPDAVIAKLKKAVWLANLAQAEDEDQGSDQLLSAEFHFLSDTVVAIAETPEGAAFSAIEPFDVITWLAERVARFTEEMLDNNPGPPFAYRGAISYGDFIVDSPFLLGPAIDEAAEAERLAEGAFVWFCPSAMREMAGHTGDLAVPYRVPLKGGQCFETLIVPPVWAGPLIADQTLYSLAVAFRMPNNQVGVQIKYQNTVKMVREALASYGIVEGVAKGVVAAHLQAKQRVKK